MWGWSLQDMLFTNNEKDPVFTVEESRANPYLLSIDGGLYESDDLVNYSEVSADIRPSGVSSSSIQDYVFVDGTYHVFFSDDANTLVASGDSLTNLGSATQTVDWPDCGAFYNEETGTYHVYTEGPEYEGQPTSNTLRHYTASDPLGPYSYEGDAIDVSDRSWHTGDPDIEKINGRYYMWLDRSISHPTYYQARAASDDLHNWTIEADRCTWTQGGDMEAHQLPDGRWVGFTEYTSANDGGIGLWTPCEFTDAGTPIPFAHL